MKKTVQLLLTSLVSFVLTLLLLEGVARLLDPGGGGFDTDGEAPLRKGADTFREELPTGVKGEDEFRILVFGDSFTWGHGIADNHLVWPAVLETGLRRREEGRGIRVINLGTPGFTTVNELELYSRVGRKLAPDLVLVQYLVNDVLPSSVNYRRVGEEWIYGRRQVNLVPHHGLHRSLEDHSRLYAFVNGRFKALQRRLWPPVKWQDMYDENFLGWRDFRRALVEIGNLAAGQGSPAVLVIFPNFLDGTWTEQDYPYRDVYAKVERAAREAGLEVLNLLPSFVREGRDFREWKVHPSDGHPGIEAHALAADAVRAFLEERGLVSPLPH